MIRLSGKSVIIVLLAVLSCSQKQSIVANRSPMSCSLRGLAVACWFVESDGMGHHGCQAASLESGSAKPQNLPFFTNLQDLRAALKESGVTSFVSIESGYMDGGWKLRGLTAAELQALK